MAFAIGTRVGPAVVRNRLRRQLRSCARDAAFRLAPGAYLVGAGPDAANLPYEDLRMIFLRALDAVTTSPDTSRPSIRAEGDVPPEGQR